MHYADWQQNFEGGIMIFPTLGGYTGGYINLEECAQTYLLENRVNALLDELDNPLLDAGASWSMIGSFHRLLGLDHSYGGWMEFRPTLLRGSYLDKGMKYLHLGVDLTAKSNTLVALDRPGRVIRIDNDYPEKHGWGTRVFVEIKSWDRTIILIYAHITDIRCKVGEDLSAGASLGQIALPSNNGGWWPHVHVQAMTEDAWSYFKDNLPKLDGYGKQEDIPKLARDFPDPMQFIRIA
jgi:murein DD-endopeptidase MepM/ murein hydrolase activator NlpD